MDFAKLARAVAREVIEMRRDFHAHPEVSFNEFRTAGIVEKRLKKLGIATRRLTETGVAGYLAGGDGPTVALRADMDALPICEETRLPYASKNDCMHACGHDCHTAILLGVARILRENRSALAGSVRFIFQPAEEIPPGGAGALVDAGVMDDVDEVYGLHVGSRVPSGKVVAEEGAQMANVDALRVTIIGKGAHGASPQLSNDPVLTAAQVVSSLQQIVSRNISPVEPAVISVCEINAGRAYNIIPETCTFTGTIRTFSKSLRRRMPRMIRRVISGVCRAHGVTFEMKYESGYDAVVNDARATGRVRRAAEELFGKRALFAVGPRMGAEDFSEYLKKAPGCFFSLGVGDRKKKTDVSHHNPRFRVDESVLWRGTAMLTKLAWERTGSQGGR